MASRGLCALVVAAAAITLTRAVGSDPVTSFPPDWPHRAPWKLTRELLLPESERIVFVVDVPRGAQPKPEALDHLASIAAKYGQRPARWVRLGEADSPNIRWVRSTQPEVELPFCERRSAQPIRPRTPDDVDSLRLFNEGPSCPDGPLPSGNSYVFVRYLGDWIGAYAATTMVMSEESCGSRVFPVIQMAQGRIAAERPPILSQAYLESRALAHEYGHVLGLASNPGHGRWERRIPYKGGAHCIHRECAVSVPSARALLKGKMLDYCAACMRDIEQAREHWLTGTTFPEVARLPQPDPEARVAKLKPYNFRQGGEADRLFGFGKDVMPALMARLPELPGKNESSPRTNATRLALRIIEEENALRSGAKARDLPPLGAGDQTSDELLRWWDAERARFMEGDDWKLPRVLEGAGSQAAGSATRGRLN